jgi:hypothetical protein
MNHRDQSNTDDEALSALLDGALPAEDAERLRQRLAREPALKARLDALEKADTAVRSAYMDVVDEPLPARVLELFGAGGCGGHGNVVELPARKPSRVFTLPLAAAAGIALTIGLSLGIVLGSRTLAPDGMASITSSGVVAPGTELYEVFESVPSAETRALAAQVSATPRLTFGTADGGYCRQVDLTSARGRTETLACRRDGGWRLEVVSFAAEAETRPGGLYRPASGPSTPIDTAIDALIDGSPLGAAAERALIGREWANAAQ